MIFTSMHGVKSIEYLSRYRAPGHEARTIRITTESDAGEAVMDLTMFGNTEAIEALPKSKWFTDTNLMGEEVA